MIITSIKVTKLNGGFLKTGRMLLRILGILLVVYIAFFSYITAHEWAGHILSDALVFAMHGTTFDKFVVIVQWLTVKMDAGHWTIGLAPFRIGGEVVTAMPHDFFRFTDWETGFSTLMGSVITMLISLIVLIVLNLRRCLRHFPWFTCTFVLASVIFDQILYTFAGQNAEALTGAVLLGVNPLLFKWIVIGLVFLQSWLLVRGVLRYFHSRRVPASPA
jgi:hypothetical protein